MCIPSIYKASDSFITVIDDQMYALCFHLAGSNFGTLRPEVFSTFTLGYNHTLLMSKYSC
jgi:hypothetical protein